MPLLFTQQKDRVMRSIMLIFIVFFSASALAGNARLDFLRLNYTIHNDSTYTLTVTEKVTMLTNYAAESWQKCPISYYPDAEKFKLLSAIVIKKDGREIAVNKSHLFTRTAADSSNAPGFNGKLTTTVVFPKLAAKDSTFIRYQIKRIKTPQFGFSMIHSPVFGMKQIKQQIFINAPKGMTLRWAKHGDYKVFDKIHGNRRIISAIIENQPEIYSEANMADLGNNQPYFIASSATRWQQIGLGFWKDFKPNIEVTPEISKLANTLTRGKHGIEKARAIYNYVAKNINYIAVTLDEAAGFIPHPAAQVLANGYGDCKDHSALMISLLKAAGIKANPVLINSGANYFIHPLPNAKEFNHVMVYLPDYKLFVNPTSEFTSFGDLSVYNSDKFVIVASNHPTLSRTPAGTADSSVYSSTKKLLINAQGDIDGDAIVKLHGRANQASRDLFNGAIPNLVAKQILMNAEGGIGDIKTTDPLDLDRDMLITSKWYSQHGINIDNECYFTIPMGIHFKSPKRVMSLIQQEKRHFPLIIGASTVSWSYVITLPEQFKIDHLPKNIHFSNTAGYYTSKYSAHDNKLFVSRSFVINQDVYSPAEYPQLKELLYQPIEDARSVVKMDRSK